MAISPYNTPASGSGTLETTTTVLSGGSHIHRRISWGAIISGVIMVVAVQLLLSLLGAGIGLGTVNVNGGSTPDASTFGMGAGIWWLVSNILALFFGGYVAAWLAGIELRWDGLLHGLVTWGVATLLTVYLLGAAVGGAVGGTFSAIGGIASTAGSGVKQVAQTAGASPDMQQQAQTYLQPASPDPATMSPQDAQKQVASSLATYAKGGSDAPAAKEQVINIMAAQQHVSHDDAAKQFDDAQAKLAQSKAQAEQTAKNAADESAAAASKTSFAAFGVLLLGAIAAAIGGSIAVQRRVQVNQRVVR